MIKTVEVTDSRGRRFGLRRPSPTVRATILKAVGADVAKNEQYMLMVYPLAYIVKIDGKPLATPKDQQQIDALFELLGDEGFETVTDAIVKHFVQAG